MDRNIDMNNRLNSVIYHQMWFMAWQLNVRIPLSFFFLLCAAADPVPVSVISQNIKYRVYNNTCVGSNFNNWFEVDFV